MKHPLQEMMDKRRQGIRCGIPSYCSANELVIEIALRRAKERSIPVLIEATANQVNQFGGYTGMKPADFYQMVLKTGQRHRPAREHDDPGRRPPRPPDLAEAARGRGHERTRSSWSTSTARAGFTRSTSTPA